MGRYRLNPQLKRRWLLPPLVFAATSALALGGCAFPPPAPKPNDVDTGNLASPTQGGSVTSVQEMSLSGDGQTVVFGAGATAALTSTAAESGAAQLFLFDARTSSVSPITVATDGRDADGDCFAASISHDGERVVFLSAARNLCPVGDGSDPQAILWERANGRFSCVSLAAQDATPDGACLDAALSADGARVAFTSRATNLLGSDENGVRFDLNGHADVFVRELTTAALTRASVTSDGFQTRDGDSRGASISSDGRQIVFVSLATTLVPADDNGVADVFLHDRSNGETRRVVSVRGVEANATCGPAMISADGEWIAFESAADNMAREDVSSSSDVFLYEVATRDVRLCSVNEAGVQLAEGGAQPTLSADGRFVAFEVLRNKRLPRDSRNYLDADVLVYDRGTGATCGLEADAAVPLLRPCSSLLCPVPLATQRPRLSANGRIIGYLASQEDTPAAYWVSLW